MHLDKELFDRLHKLAALDTNDQHHDALLKQVESIVGLVDKIQEYEFDEQIDQSYAHCAHLNSGLKDGMSRDELLGNVQHPVTNQMISLEVSTNE